MSAPVAERELRTWGCSPCTATAMGSYPAAVAPLQSRTRLSPQWPAAPLAKFSMRPTRGGVATAVTVPSTFHGFEGDGNGLGAAGTVSPERTAPSGLACASTFPLGTILLFFFPTTFSAIPTRLERQI